ncbi:MAG: DNA topoisomerase VI subunit B [Oligoflexales bacterium]
MAKKQQQITTSSTAEYFSKNLQQVGFSSPTKAVLTTLKEAVDNSLDACEDAGILPEISIVVEKLGPGTMKNTDQIKVRVVDNGPGIAAVDLAKVFGEYLASSKFGRGRCSRGQQGIGISAATTWAMQTSATGVKVISKTDKQRKAVSCKIEVDLKQNKGVMKDKEDIDWDRPHGTSVEFIIDGRIQLNGEAGLVAFLKGNILVNPHLTLRYKLPDEKEFVSERVTKVVPEIPDATEPHPHTLKLGEFMSHAKLFGKTTVKEWLKKGFSRIGDSVLTQLGGKLEKDANLLTKSVSVLTEADTKKLYTTIQDSEILPPSTRSVLSIGEESLAKSILRLGSIDFFSVVTRKPTICDHKPVQVEVALARSEEKGIDHDAQVQVLRFANRVPLQFDKAGCAIVKAITSVNWKTYGLRQSNDSLPLGPYIVAVSVVSPFIKFKNASKETVESSDELVEEIRRALMQAGQRLSKHIRKESKEADLEEKIQHIEKFAPILVECLVNITKAPPKTKEAAEQGLIKILGRDAATAKKELSEAEKNLERHMEEKRRRLGEHVVAELDELQSGDGGEDGEESEFPEDGLGAVVEESAPTGKKKKGEKKVAAQPTAKAKAQAKPAAKAKEKTKPAKTTAKPKASAESAKKKDKKKPAAKAKPTRSKRS